MKKVWVAVPAYTGQICVETAYSLNVEIYESLNRNVPFLVQYHEGDSMIHRCRNMMMMRFLASDFTDLIFLDSDVGFESGALMKLVSHPVDIVGAAYPFKTDEMGFPVRYMNADGLYADPEHGLLEMYAMPAGCLRITRKALEAMIAKFPELKYAEHNAPQGHAYSFFDFVIRNGIMYGEDFVFCALAREAGFKIWCDTEIQMQHVGQKRFKGHFGNWLRGRGAKDDPFKVIQAFNDKYACKVSP
jgi:hypothetical protein